MTTPAPPKTVTIHCTRCSATAEVVEDPQRPGSPDGMEAMGLVDDEGWHIYLGAWLCAKHPHGPDDDSPDAPHDHPEGTDGVRSPGHELPIVGSPKPAAGSAGDAPPEECTVCAAAASLQTVRAAAVAEQAALAEAAQATLGDILAQMFNYGVQATVVASLMAGARGGDEEAEAMLAATAHHRTPGGTVRERQDTEAHDAERNARVEVHVMLPEELRPAHTPAGFGCGITRSVELFRQSDPQQALMDMVTAAAEGLHRSLPIHLAPTEEERAAALQRFAEEDAARAEQVVSEEDPAGNEAAGSAASLQAAEERQAADEAVAEAVGA